MSDSYLKELKQRDKKLKQSLVLSSNYKIRYLKRKYIQSTKNINSINPIFNKTTKKNYNFILYNSAVKSQEKRTKSKIEKKPINNKYKINSENYNNNDKDINFKFSDYNLNGDDEDYNNNNNKNNENDNYNIILYKSEISNKSQNNKKKYLSINLKKFINYKEKSNYNFNTNIINNISSIYTDNTFKRKNYFNNLNKIYYSSEKKNIKLNLNILNDNIRYLKLNNSNIHIKPKNKRTSYIKSPSINFFIENKSTLNYNINTYKTLSKEKTEQFHMDKIKNKKFENLKKDDNILINYYPTNINDNNLHNKIKSLDTLTINSNHIEFNIIGDSNRNKNIIKENKEIKEIIIKNPNIININKNNNSKQFNKFKEKFKMENKEKNYKIKISNKIKNLALGLENLIKNEEKNEENNNQNDKNINIENSNNKNDVNDKREKIPIIYKKKKKTKIEFNDK